jgi:hypothetical protein
MTGETEPQAGFWHEHRPEALTVAASLGAASLAAWGLMQHAHTQRERAGLVPEVDYRDAARILVEPRLESNQRHSVNAVGAFVLLCPGFRIREISDELHYLPTSHVKRAASYLRENQLIQYKRPPRSDKKPEGHLYFSAMPALRWVAGKPEEYTEFAACLQQLQPRSSESS